MMAIQSGYDFGKNKFVVAGFKPQTGTLTIRPTTPNNMRPEAKLFGAKHGFRVPPAKQKKRHVAQFEGSTNNSFGIGWYSNVLRKTDFGSKADEDDTDPAAKAINRLFVHLQKSKLDVQDNFARMDTDGSGELDEEEFKAALLDMGLAMSDEEMQLVMRELDTDGGGTVGIDELLNKMKQIDSRLAAGGAGAVQEALDKIFDWIQKTRSKVVDMFNKIDVDGNGELDKDEFRFAMSEMGLELTEGEVQLVMQELDTDGEGTIGTDEFLERMRAIHRERRKAEKESAVKMGRQSEYERKREKNKFVGNRHPATEGIDVSYSMIDDYEDPDPPARRWRPSTQQRHPPSRVGFGSSWQPAPQEYSLPDIDSRYNIPVDPPSGELDLLNKSSLRKTYQTGIKSVKYMQQTQSPSKSEDNHRAWHEESIRRLSEVGEKDRRLYNRPRVQRLPTRWPQGAQGDPFRVSGLNTSLGHSLSDQRLNAGMPKRFEFDPEGLRPRVPATLKTDMSMRDPSLRAVGYDRKTHRFDQSLYADGGNSSWKSMSMSAL